MFDLLKKASWLSLFGILILQALPAQAGERVTPPAPVSAPLWESGAPGDPLYTTAEQACNAKLASVGSTATFENVTADNIGDQFWTCHWANDPIHSAVVTATCVGNYTFHNGLCHRGGIYGKRDCLCDPGGGSPVSTPIEPQIGNPVGLTYGAKVEQETDYETADGRMSIKRSYFGLPDDIATAAAGTPIPGFGTRWHGIVPGRITIDGWNADHAQYISEYGVRSDFTSVGSDPSTWVFDGEDYNRRKLTVLSPGTAGRADYFWTQPAVPNGAAEVRMDLNNGEYILFRRAGPPSQLRYLVAIEHGFPDGYKIWFDYPDIGEYPSVIRDSFSRQINLTWIDVDRYIQLYINVPVPYKVLSRADLPDGTKLNYTYDLAHITSAWKVRDRLQSVSHKDASGNVLWGRSYLYEDTINTYAITGKVDQLGRRLSKYTYNLAEMVETTELAGGVNKYTIVNLEEYGGLHAYRNVTNALGYRQDYTFSRRSYDYTQPLLLDQIDGYATATIPATTMLFRHTGNFGDYHYLGMTNERGFETNQNNDGNLRPYNIIEGQNSNDARTTSLAWHSTLDLPTQIVKQGLTVNLTYEAGGRLKTRTETDTTTSSAPYSTAGQTRQWTYTWSNEGRVTAVDGPKGLDADGNSDIEAYTYDASGNLLTSTNAVGKVTQFGAYDANGRPGYMRDPNGVYTRYVYDGLGRVTTITVEDPAGAAGNAVTSMEYDVEGRVTGLTLPATEKMFVDYDLAGRTTAVRAANGEKTTFTYDAMSNVTELRVKRVDGTNARSVISTFDELGRTLTQTLGGNRNKSWAYDAGGNPTTVTGARSNATVQAFDALDRLVSTVAADTGTEATTLDAKDLPISFTDANSVSTTFVHNGFGEVIGETSPDRGSRTFYYDAAGDLTASIDGRGQRINFVRDALGRVTSKTPVGRPASEVITYTYDITPIPGTKGIGRLGRVVDGTGNTVFKYDHRGNMLIKRQKIGTSVGSELQYTYDLGDRVTSITYPSGMLVSYDRDARGRVATVRAKPTPSSAETVLASNLTYEPFGSLLSASYGNGLSLAQGWGNIARLQSKRLYQTSSGTNLSLLTYSYDGDENITAITDGVDPTRNLTFTYDPVDRLTKSVVAAGNPRRQDFIHDKNGNRIRTEARTGTTDGSPPATSTYALATGTNRLTSITDASGARTIAYDANGNTLTETRPGGMTVSAGYDGYARLISYAQGATALTHGYNGLDDRVSTMQGADVRRFLYDMSGRVLGEYGTSIGDVKAETIWLTPDAPGSYLTLGGDDGVGGYAPLAMSTGGTFVWAHGNHLGVPVVLTDTTGAAVIPTGYTKPGFPGQMQTLADLYYNRYRDYDPTLGRYIQSDPIGLSGSSNLYLYAEGNPSKNVDPQGLSPLFDLIIPLLREIHYDRNRYNKKVPLPYAKLHWCEMKPRESIYHNMGGAAGNRKFVECKEQRYEQVYRPNGCIENDPLNKGTFNFFGSRANPALHFMYDVLPYYVWGNTPEDRFRYYERFDATRRYIWP